MSDTVKGRVLFMTRVPVSFKDDTWENKVSQGYLPLRYKLDCLVECLGEEASPTMVTVYANAGAWTKEGDVTEVIDLPLMTPEVAPRFKLEKRAEWEAHGFPFRAFIEPGMKAPVGINGNKVPIAACEVEIVIERGWFIHLPLEDIKTSDKKRLLGKAPNVRTVDCAQCFRFDPEWLEAPIPYYGLETREAKAPVFKE